MQAVLKQRGVWKTNQAQPARKDKKRMGFIAGLFGCWHKGLSRPFTTKSDSYRVCLDCGARRGFDPKTLKTYGSFYFPLETDPKIEQV